MNLKELVQLARCAPSDAEILIASVLSCKKADLALRWHETLEEATCEHLEALFARKRSGEPLDYILGQLDFFGLRLKVDPRVLVPRPESEILLSKIAQRLKETIVRGKVAWDLCTGSGCLGLGMKKQFPELMLVLSDFSVEALDVARENAADNGLDVTFLYGDLLAPFTGMKADFVVCNPPYVAKKEYEGLSREVKKEPYCALVAGESGLEFYERLAHELPSYLNEKAQVFLEIGTGQGSKLLDIFNQSCWKTKYYEKDWAGCDRFFFLEKQ